MNSEPGITRTPHASCDRLLEAIAYDEAALAERVAALEADRRAYREMARAAIHALHDGQRALAQARQTIAALREASRSQSPPISADEAAA